MQFIIVGHLCTGICFKIGQIIRAYRRRAQDSEVMVVSFEIITVGNFCSVICF